MAKKQTDSTGAPAPLKIPPIKGGGSPLTFLDGDREAWTTCFGAAVTGLLAAQRNIPRPDLVVKWCAAFADIGVREFRRRRQVK
jgi:hypothetical protein